MRPLIHFCSGISFAILLFLFFPQISFLGLILLILSTVLIDVDHYLYYFYKTNNLNLRKAYQWFILIEKKIEPQIKFIVEYKWPIMIFHGVEFVFLLSILCFFNDLFKFILLGVLLHYFLDFCELVYKRLPPMLKFSQLYILLRNKNKASWDNILSP